MIKEPKSKYVDYLTNCGDLVHHYTVTHNNVEYQCMTLCYASYLAEKFNAKVWNIHAKKYIRPFIGLCSYCKKRREIHFVGGGRGSFPAEDDTFSCGECGSVYGIKDILMDTGAYKKDE